MADRIEFSVSATPVETIQAGDGATNHDVMAAEVKQTVGGSGSAPVANYQGTNAKQGFGGSDATGGTKYYVNCVDNSYTQISAETAASFVYIKNTGYLYNSSSALGNLLPNKECVEVVTVNSGTTTIAFLAPGEAIVLKALASTKVLDCTKIKVKAFDSDGSSAAASDHIAVEFLVVN